MLLYHLSVKTKQTPQIGKARHIFDQSCTFIYLFFLLHLNKDGGEIRGELCLEGYFVLGGNALYNTKNVETRQEMRKRAQKYLNSPPRPNGALCTAHDHKSRSGLCGIL